MLRNIQIYYFYILRCSDGTLYCGMSNDLDNRLAEHNLGGAKSAKYTRGRGPVKLVYQESFNSKSEAMKRECEVKKWTKIKKEILVSNSSGVVK